MNIPYLERLVFFREDGKVYLLKFNLDKGVYEKLAYGEHYERFGFLILMYNQGLVYTVFAGDEKVHVFKGIPQKNLILKALNMIIFQEGESFYSYNGRKELVCLGSLASEKHWLFSFENRLAFIEKENHNFFQFESDLCQVDNSGSILVTANGGKKSYQLESIDVR